MAIVNHTARTSQLVSYHLIEPGDTLTDLNDWLSGLIGREPNSPNGRWLRQNPNGTFSPYEYMVDASVGQYLVVRMTTATEAPDGLIDVVDAAAFPATYGNLDE